MSVIWLIRKRPKRKKRKNSLGGFQQNPVDANLPPRLCTWLRSHGHEAEHVFDLDLLTATDTEIWERGRVEGLVVFSKDVDFYDRALLFGMPPQVVHVAD